MRADVLGALRDAAASADRRVHHAARVASALIMLDESLQHADGAAAGDACARLRALEPGLIGHLEAAADASDPAPYIARFYPY